MTSTAQRHRFEVRRSTIHGRGIYATTELRQGDDLLEYEGQVITWNEANERYFDRAESEDSSATYYFDLGDGRVIDGAVDGNEARFLNHSCRPNCSAEIGDGTVHIAASRDIGAGEELTLDYALAVDDPDEPGIRDLYTCNCAAPDCRRTMLAPAD